MLGGMAEVVGPMKLDETFECIVEKPDPDKE